MKHTQYLRISEKASIAVLFIHGIVGTPNHFQAFVPLVPESVSIYNMLLDGHGKNAKAFSKASIKKWQMQVGSVVEELAATHENIYIVAHSLGTLLAIEQAIHNEKISQLFLLAVPLHLSLKPKMLLNAWKVCYDKIQPDDDEALAAKACYGIEQDKNLLHYIGWLPRFLELFAMIRQSRQAIKLLHTTCRAYQSGRDEMVSGKSIKYLMQNPCISVNELKNSGHYYYPKEDFDFLIAEFCRMFPTDT